MSTDELDLVEREDVLTQPVLPDPLDVRDVAKSGGPLLVYLQFLMVGPLGIGTLAIISSASTPWEHLPVTIRSASSHYSDGVVVPENLLVGELTANSEQSVAEGAAASGTALPVLKVSIYKPDIADIQLDLAEPAGNLDAQPNPSPLPAVPQAPTNVTAE